MVKVFKNSKKGFTLIELLAVILILGIIALIALPSINNIIDQAKESALKATAYGLRDAASNYVALNNLKSIEMERNTSLNANILEFKGKVDNASFIINDNDDISVVVIKNGKCGYLSFDGVFKAGNVSNNTCDIKGMSIPINFSYVLNSDDVSKSGRLHVQGKYIYDENNNQFQMKGISTESFGDFVNDQVPYDNFLIMKEWGINTVRLQINPTSTYFPDWQYIGHEQEILNEAYEIIDFLIENDLYVIVDWHNYDMIAYEEETYEFFDEISSKYKDSKNIIYEIANEPTQDWNDIKDLSIEIIDRIRVNAPNSIIIVPGGTRNGSPDSIINNEINRKNIVYSFHNYVLKSTYPNAAMASKNDIPLVVTEWAATRCADGVCTFKEDVANTFVEYMNLNSIGWIWFSINGNRVTEANILKASYRIVKKWNNDLDDSELTEAGDYFKNLLQQNGIPSSVKNKLKNRNDEYAFYSDEYRTKIAKIIFENRIEKTSIKNSIVDWDVSDLNLNNVIAYLTYDDELNYILHIASREKIYFPADSGNLFKGFSILKRVDNTKYLDTSEVTHFTKAFGENPMLEEFDMSTFDFKNVISITNLFQQDSSISRVVFPDKIESPKITSMAYMFSNCSNLSEIVNVNKFDTSSVTNMSGMFGGLSSLEALDLSGFNTSSVTNFDYMFHYSNAIKNLDISTFDIKEEATISKMLQNIKNTTTIKVKNENIRNRLSTVFPNPNYVIK